MAHALCRRAAAMLCGLIIALSGCAGRAAPAVAAAPPPAAADPATRLSLAARDLLGRIGSTGYAHRVDIDPDAGTAVTDCSGLVRWLLARTSPAHLAAIASGPGHRHPLATDFQHAFADGAPGWQRITRAADLRAGDVLAWSFREQRPGRSTGHVLIVDGEAQRLDDGTWSVAVIDATSTPHDADTRVAGDGVGRGLIRVQVDGDGTMAAVRTRSEGPFRNLPIAAGRPLPP